MSAPETPPNSLSNPGNPADSVIWPQEPILQPIDIPLITFVPDGCFARITGVERETPLETPDHIDYQVSKKDILSRLASRLSNLYLSAGPGVVTADEMRLRHSWEKTHILQMADRLQDMLPESLFMHQPDDSFWFGTFALASRHATEAEKELRLETMRRQRQEALARKKEEVLAADAEKVNLIEIDHALITADDGRRFYMPVETTDSIIAVRTLQAIRSIAQANPALYLEEFKVLAAEVWQSMPVMERELFTDKEAELYGGSGKLLVGAIRKCIRQVANPLHVAQSSAADALFVIERGPNLSIDLKQEPPVEPYDDTFMPIFPPGTEKSIIHNTLIEVEEREVQELRALLEPILAASALSHRQAIDVIDIHMNRRTKILARRILGENFSPTEVDALLTRWDDHAIT